MFVGALFALMCVLLQYSEDSRAVGQAIAYVLMLLPIFSLTYGLLIIANRPIFAALNGEAMPHPLSFSSGGITIPYFIVAIVLYATLTILYEKGKICRRRVDSREI